jgi:AcrR family transcriptional regulator
MSANPVPLREDYHHGNLAEAALTEGLRMLEADEELSMRAVARAVGVAHRALFNHYTDRFAFEAALSAHGFSRLAAVLKAAASAADFVRAYVDFALAQSALYDLMMRQSYAAFEGHPQLRASADQVIAVALKTLAPHAGDAESGRRAVMRLWMIAHGGVGLHRSGVLRARTDAAFVEELLRIAGLAADQREGEQALWTKPNGDAS